jgi:hypothetical protein
VHLQEHVGLGQRLEEGIVVAALHRVEQLHLDLARGDEGVRLPRSGRLVRVGRI